MKGPDFFIVGAPKCGTTALDAYLRQHPEIGMCDRKETQHFAVDLRPRFTRTPASDSPFVGDQWRTDEEYLGLFGEAQHAKRIGEASVWYLYSSEAPRQIERFSPEADIIVMLRNPVQMLPSLHSEFVYMGIEPEADLGAALALDAERESGETPPRFPPRSYRSAAAFAEQVRRYFEVFGSDSVHVIVYDDFSADTAASYRRVCEFLGVDTAFEPEFEVVNSNKRVRSRLLRDVSEETPTALRRAIHSVTSEAVRRRAGARLRRLNTRYEGRDPIAPATRRELQRIADEQAAELAPLLGRDLSDWTISS